MSSRHFITKLMTHTKARNHQALANRSGLEPAKISLMFHGKKGNITISTLLIVSGKTGLKVSTLAGWWVGEDIS